MNENRTKTNNHFLDWSLILLMTAIVVAVALLILFKQSLRLDEAQSIWQTSRSPKMMFVLVSQDVHVPLWHLVLHYWEIFFGTSLAAVRSLSLIFFVATIPLFYILARECFYQEGNLDSRDTALFATALLAFSPFLNWYGSEARMYSLMVMLTVINMYFFVKIFRKPSVGAWWGYFISGFFGMYSHYFFFFNFISQLVFYFFNRKIFPPKSGRIFIIIGCALAVLFLPWLFLVFKEGFAATTQPLLQTPTSVNLFDTYEEFLFGFQTDHFNTVLVSLWPACMLLAIFALSTKRGKKAADAASVTLISRIQVYFFVIAAFLPVLLSFFISFAKPIYLSRYLIISVPALYLFLGWFTSMITPRIRLVVRSALVLGMVVALFWQSLSVYAPVKENFAGAATYLTANIRPSDTVVLVPPFIIYPIEYYYTGNAALLTIPEWNRYATPEPSYNSSELSGYAEQAAANHAQVWLVFSEDNDQGYNQEVLNYFEDHYQRLQEIDFPPNIEVYEYKTAY